MIYHIYLAGNHKDSSSWRDDFQSKINTVTRISPYEIFCIDPFYRNIDEKNSDEIVSRDIAIISDHRLNYVLLKSLDSFGSLSTGTASEMIIARSLGKPVIVLLEPLKNGEDEWIHPFIEKFAVYITRNTDDAIKWIDKDIQNGTCHGTLQDIIVSLTEDYIFPLDKYHPFIKS
jgi:hypothetical protein